MKTKFNFRAIKNKNLFGYLSLTAILLVFVSFIILIVFVVKESVPGFQHYGFSNVFLSGNFNFQSANGPVSFWLPLAVTLFIAGLGLLIAAPLGIKTALLIHFRIKNKKFKRFLGFFITILSGVPSVIFGIFARDNLGEFFKIVFHLPNSYNLITGAFMLAFMILPTIIFLVLQALQSVNPDLLMNSISLGVSRTKSIYQVVLRKIFPYIMVALLIALGRGIGETMAVSMILQAENYNNVFNTGGFYGFISSNLTPLGAVISTNMFSDGASLEARSLLFAFGWGLMVIMMLLNGFIYVFMKRLQKKQSRKNSVFNQHKERFYLCINSVKSQIAWQMEKLFYAQAKQIQTNQNIELGTYVLERKHKHPLSWFNTTYKLAGEWLASLVVTAFIGWILLVIIIRGFAAWSSPQSTLTDYGKDSTGLAFANTIMIIIIAILISLPFGLLSAIYLNEYCKKKWIKQSTLFVLDILGSTPSIIFALFGLSFFILNLGWTSSGTQGRSLIAGALTISMVILPNLIRMIQSQLEAVPQEQRDNSYALGVSKFKTIYRIVLPQALGGIIQSTISTVGRIMGETAPLYLTAGLSSSRTFALNFPGQTLTTRIYAQLVNNNITQASHIMYESALLSIFLIIFIIFAGNILLPWILANQKYTIRFLAHYYWNHWQIFLLKQKSWWLKKLLLYINNPAKKQQLSQRLLLLEQAKITKLLNWTK